MKMSKMFMRHVVLVLSIALVSASMPVYAAGPTPEELRHTAFVRGGNAIGEALNAKPEATTLVSAALEESIPAKAPVPTPRPQEGQGGMNKVLLTTLIAGFVVSGILIYHYATGPGASVRNCSTC
jgi:hypothetical protein